MTGPLRVSGLGPTLDSRARVLASERRGLRARLVSMELRAAGETERRAWRVRLALAVAGPGGSNRVLKSFMVLLIPPYIMRVTAYQSQLRGRRYASHTSLSRLSVSRGRARRACRPSRECCVRACVRMRLEVRLRSAICESHAHAARAHARRPTPRASEKR